MLKMKGKKRIETSTRVKLSAHLLNQAPTPRRLPQFSRLESPNPFPSSSSSRRSVDEQIRPCNAAAGTTRARPAGPRLSYRGVILAALTDEFRDTG
jgi:hypothetical protein